MMSPTIEIVKNQIAERRLRLTPEELLKENYKMVVIIGERIFKLCKDSYNYWDDTRCFDFAKDQLSMGYRWNGNTEESINLNLDLSEYEVVVFRDVITSFYSIPQSLCKCILESPDYEVVLRAIEIINSIYEMEVSGVGSEQHMEAYANRIHAEYDYSLENFDFNNGREGIKDFGKHKKDSRKDFKNNILIPIRSGEVQHHLTDTIIIGIQKEVHERLSGYDRETHRKKVLEWLDEQAEKAKIAHAYLVLDEEEK